MILRIGVTDDDIRKGITISPTGCPIALAMSRETGTTVAVGTTSAFIGAAEDLRVELPEIAQKFVSKFDAGLPVQPFSFDIEITEEDYANLAAA